MALVAFTILEQIGHVGPTLKLAGQLRDAGHEVIYVGQWESDAATEAMTHFDGAAVRLIGREGFPFLPILERALRASPRGARVLEDYVRAVAADPALRPDHPAVQAMWGEQLRLLRSGELGAPLGDRRPDLWITDVCSMLPLPFLPSRRGEPTVRIGVTPALGWSPTRPPIGSDVVPSDGPRGTLRVQRAWFGVLLNKFLSPWKRAHIPWVLRYARAAGYPWRALDFTPENVPVALNADPRIVMCPRAFEFPRRGSRRVFYADAGLGSTGGDAVFDWDWLRPDARLICCGFGSRSGRRGRQMEFHNALIRAVTRRDDLQCVIAHGGTLSAADFPDAGENVRLLDWVPQYRLLKHASLMITHCGLGSMKEAIARGVPMILLPHEADQPGNAARAVAHGIGVRADAADLTAERLGALIDRVLGDRDMKERVRAMQRGFRRAEAERRAFRYVQSRLARISR
jgi:UDP:flavonoid glycosyltransferase YjiC (YdhE family)